MHAAILFLSLVLTLKELAMRSLGIAGGLISKAKVFAQQPFPNFHNMSLVIAIEAIDLGGNHFAKTGQNLGGKCSKDPACLQFSNESDNGKVSQPNALS